MVVDLGDLISTSLLYLSLSVVYGDLIKWIFQGFTYEKSEFDGSNFLRLFWFYPQFFNDAKKLCIRKVEEILTEQFL